VAAARKLLYQMPYEARFTAISHYYGAILKEKITKKEMKDKGIHLDR
jgi:hypothetical protein